MKAIFKFLIALVVMVFLISGCEKLYGIEENATGISDIEAIEADVEEVEDEGELEAAVEEEEAEEEGAQVVVYEGELVNVQVTSTGGEIEFTYSEPLNDSGQWQTEEGDAGVYNVAISASDGKTTSSKTFKLLVKRKNKAPKISRIDDFSVTVGDTIIFEPEVTDPDDDEIKLTYSGWMNSNEKTVTEDDIGTHKVTIKASDGQLTDRETVEVTVVAGNRAPVIEPIDDIEVFEGETVKLEPEVSDPEGDEVEISFSEPLDDDGEWQTGYDDAGEYEVTITASDGELESETTVDIEVINKLSPEDWDFEVVIG